MTKDSYSGLATPTIHINGTSLEVLSKQYTDAAIAVSNAISALYSAAPNARDYYVQGPDAYNHAAKDHAERINKLNSVYRELEEIIGSLDGYYDEY